MGCSSVVVTNTRRWHTPNANTNSGHSGVTPLGRWRGPLTSLLASKKPPCLGETEHYAQLSGPSKTGPSPAGRTGPSPAGKTGPSPSGKTGPSPPGKTGPSPPGKTGPSPPGKTVLKSHQLRDVFLFFARKIFKTDSSRDDCPVTVFRSGIVPWQFPEVGYHGWRNLRFPLPRIQGSQKSSLFSLEQARI